MVHGQPDYGAYAAKKTVGSMADNAELATRLGSPMIYDRKGDIMFLDGFESGLSPYRTYLSGLGSSATQSNEHSRDGAFSAKLVCGSNLSRQAALRKYLPYPVLGNLGLEVSFTMHDDIELVWLDFALYSPLGYIGAELVYDEDNSVLQYLNSLNVRTPFQAGVVLYEGDYMFHTMKLVVDYTNRMYIRGLVDEQTYDISTLAVYGTAIPQIPYLVAAIYAQGKVGENATIWVDNFIITQNEP